MKSLLIALISIGFCAPMLSQSSDEHLRLQVLNYNMKEQNFIFGEWKKENGSETHLNYLGEIETSNNESFKIMTSCWIWGVTRKVTNLILVYDKNNNLLGNYYLNTKCQLPNEIVDNKLIFKPSECAECDNAITKVDFYEGIPKNFYLGCKRGQGNIYSFYLSY